MIGLIKLFEQIKWAENGGIADLSEGDYKAGWAFLGDDTPTVQDFNYVQQMNDAKDKWLYNQINEVLKSERLIATEQEKDLLLRAIKAMAKSYSTPKEITDKTENTVEATGHTHKIASGNTERKGIIQLTEDTTSNSTELGLAAKAGKKLKDLIDALTRNLNNYIPNSKKSSAVDSPSADTVATSAAVKAAYDNADSRINRNGDAMQGALQGKSGELTANNTNNVGFVFSGDADTGIANPRDGILQFIVNGELAAQFDFSSTNLGLFFRNAAGYSMSLQHDGNFSWNNESGQSRLNINQIIKLISDYYNFRGKFTQSFYSGKNSSSMVYRIPITDNQGIKIYNSQIQIDGNSVGHRFNLAEEFAGFRIPWATAGDGHRRAFGAEMTSDKQVTIHCETIPYPQTVNLMIIGLYKY